MRSPIFAASALLVALASSACGDTGSGSGPPPAPPPKQIKQPGDLAQGTFTYVCSSPSDAFCNSNNGFPTGSIPTVAVGAGFILNFTYDTVEDIPVSQAAAPGRIDYITNATGPKFGLKTLVPGFTALFGFVKPTAQYPTDFLHLQSAKPHHLELTAIQNPTGFRAFVAAEGSRDPLAGSFPCRWTTSDANVAKITSDPTSNVVSFEFGANGAATLHIDLAGFASDIPITVNR